MGVLRLLKIWVEVVDGKIKQGRVLCEMIGFLFYRCVRYCKYVTLQNSSGEIHIKGEKQESFSIQYKYLTVHRTNALLHWKHV